MSAISRSMSGHHLSSSLSTAGTDAHPITLTASHLRQSSSLGIGHHHDDHHPHYPTSANGYDVYEEIGVGAFATVYQATVKETGEQVAIKIIDLDQFNTNWDEIRREILIMSLVHHPNVVRILTSFVEEQDLWIVMPLLEGGSCAHIMKTLFPQGMKDEAMIATILKEVLNGLLYFHKDGRLHRDLKAGNVLLSKTGEVQLADFGVAGTLMENGDRKRARTTFTGTPCWMAPEVMEHSEVGYDEKADIWSFGITAMELAYGRAPYAKYPPMKVMVLTLQEEPPNCQIYHDNSYEFSHHFHAMIAKCLRKDAEKRPSVKKLLEHKFFKSAKDKNYLVEKIIKKMPVRKSASAKPLNVQELRHPTVRSAADDESDDKPISVGSWVFDKEEFEQLKRQAQDQKSNASDGRNKAVQASYADDETPKTSAAPSRNVSNVSQAPTRVNSAAVPQAKGANQAFSSDSSDEHSDEEHHGLPDFSNPAGYVDTAPPALSKSPLTGGSNASSPAASTPALSPGVTSHPSSGPSSPPVEHQEGRFMVSDDGDTGEEEQIHFEPEPATNAPIMYGESYPSHVDYYNCGGAVVAPEPSVDDSTADAFPAFHTDLTEQQEKPYEDYSRLPMGETHVGRFAVLDDENDNE